MAESPWTLSSMTPAGAYDDRLASPMKVEKTSIPMQVWKCAILATALALIPVLEVALSLIMDDAEAFAVFSSERTATSS